MATVSIFMPEMSLTTGNVLWLRKSSDYSVVNTGGDALTESGTSGWFTATVTETWAEQLSVTVVDTSSLIPRTGWLPVGGTTVAEGTAVLVGGSGDWTADERTAIRSILGVPASGTTPADPTVGILDTTRDLVVSYIAAALATVNGTSGTIVGFPTTLNMGDSYTDEANASIHVFIRDSLDAPILAVGSFNFTDPEFAPEVTITQSGSTGRVTAVVTYVDPGAAESYLKIEIPSSQTRRAAPGVATIQCLLKWVDVDGKVLCQKTLAQQAVTWNEMV